MVGRGGELGSRSGRSVSGQRGVFGKFPADPVPGFSARG